MSKIKNIKVHELWVLVWENDTKIIRMCKYMDSGNIGTAHKVYLGETKQDVDNKIQELGLLTLKEFKRLSK